MWACQWQVIHRLTPAYCRICVSSCLQYGYGSFAPGYKGGDAGKYACGHHLLLAHAKTKALYDEKYRAQQVCHALTPLTNEEQTGTVVYT